MISRRHVTELLSCAASTQFVCVMTVSMTQVTRIDTGELIWSAAAEPGHLESCQFSAGLLIIFNHSKSRLDVRAADRGCPLLWCERFMSEGYKVLSRQFVATVDIRHGNVIELRNAASGKIVTTLDVGSYAVHDMVWRPDDGMLCVACRDGLIKMYQRRTRHFVLVAQASSVQAVHKIFSHDGRQLLSFRCLDSAPNRVNVRVIDFETNQTTMTTVDSFLDGRHGHNASLLLCPLALHGTAVIARCNTSIQKLDLASGAWSPVIASKQYLSHVSISDDLSVICYVEGNNVHHNTVCCYDMMYQHKLLLLIICQTPLPSQITHLLLC
jgi:WD40 repeat protein